MKNLLVIIVVALSSSVFAQTENFWVKKADFAGLKRERAVGFAIGNKGYIATGQDTAEVVLNDLWEYDPTLDSWTQKANLPGVGRRNASAFVLNNEGYVGLGMDNAEAGPGSPLTDFYKYNPVSNTWVATANYPGGSGTGIYFAASFAMDNKGYICGGKRGPDNYIDELWEYKPSIDTWTQKADFPGGVRYQLTSFTIGFDAYVGLGIDKDNLRKDFWKYSPAFNTWEPIADYLGEERASVISFTMGHRGFVGTGTNGGFQRDIWMYNPVNDDWSPMDNYGGSNRKNAVAFVINNRAYVGTGKGYSGKKQSMWEYTPPSVLALSENDVEMAIYPNPVQENFTIQMNVDFDKVAVYSLSGELVRTFERKNGTYSIPELSKGIYLIKVLEGVNTIAQQKMIKL